MIIIWLLLSITTLSCGNLLSAGISSQVIEIKPNMYQMIGFPQSSLNQTEVQVHMACQDNVDMEFEVQFVLRSSPCDKEFFDARNGDRLKDLLKFYFEDDSHIPDTYSYDKMVWYKSGVQKFSCLNTHGSLFLEGDSKPMEVRNVSGTAHSRSKRETYPGLNGMTADGGAKLSLTSWKPVQRIPVDGIYFLVMKVTGSKFPAGSNLGHNVTVTVEWRGPYGFLSAIDYPLLRFYILMCVFYAILALVWMVLCIKYYKDILRIQYWIGAVIILGMLEKAFFLSEYSTMNTNGMSTQGVIEMAELVSCAKRTMSRVLVIIVSVGYGVVKPRLGNTLSQVAGVGLVYFVFCAIEGLARVSKNHVEAQKQKQFAALPLVITEMVIFYWIYTSLGQTMTTLRIRRNEVKLSVYRHFTNTLLFAVVASICFMIWSLTYHVFPVCLKEWKGIWVDTAFWHVLFCSILVVIMFLWRPSQNNQRYAFTPLLDDSEDENDNEDEIFNAGTPGYQLLTQREAGAGAESRKQREREREDMKLQEDLKWIENHVPTSLTETLLVDEEEEKEARELEVSKML